MSLMGKKGISRRDRRLMRVLGPKGLVAAVLSSLPLQWAQATHASAKMIEACQAIQDVAYATVLFSILTCSLIIIITEKKDDKKDAETAEETSGEAEEKPAVEEVPAAEVIPAAEVEAVTAPAEPASDYVQEDDAPAASSNDSDLIPE